MQTFAELIQRDLKRMGTLSTDKIKAVSLVKRLLAVLRSHDIKLTEVDKEVLAEAQEFIENLKDDK